MIKSIKKLCTFMLALIAMLAMANVALAAETPTITFNGITTEFAFGSEYTATDLFDGFKGVMPGDDLEQQIVFTNSAKKFDYVKVYMRVVPHTDTVTGGELTDGELTDDGTVVAPTGNPMSENVAAKTTFNDMVAFLNQLEMQVYHNDKGTGNVDQLIYEAKLDELADLKTDNIYLGKFKEGETSDITVKLQVPREMGNEYANKIGEVDWVITVEGYTDDGGGGGDEKPNPPNPPTPPNPPGGGDDPSTPSEPGGPGEPGSMGNTDTITVNKVWSGDAASKRPESATFTLYQNDVAYDVITLGEWNNWTYTWTGLDMTERWQVVETELAGYEAAYSLNGNVLTVTNIANSPETLLKTGQLNWPIAVLGGFGAAFMLAGLAMMFKKKHSNA